MIVCSGKEPDSSVWKPFHHPNFLGQSGCWWGHIQWLCSYVAGTYTLMYSFWQAYQDHAEHLRHLADRLESNSLLSTITTLTDTLQKSVTDKTTSRWLTDKQEEITAHRSELINTIRQAAEIWREAASHVEKYEKGCLAAQDCITGMNIERWDWVCVVWLWFKTLVL